MQKYLKMSLYGCYQFFQEYLQEKKSVYIWKPSWETVKCFEESLQGGKVIKKKEISSTNKIQIFVFLVTCGIMQILDADSLIQFIVYYYYYFYYFCYLMGSFWPLYTFCVFPYPAWLSGQSIALVIWRPMRPCVLVLP